MKHNSLHTCPIYSLAHEDHIANKSQSPVDWKIRDSPPGNNRFGIKYPFILGEDVAGEVLHVGSGVKHLQKGDRVFAHALGLGAGDTACM